MTDRAALDRVIDEAAEAYGRLDVAFANAGIDPGVGFVGAWAAAGGRGSADGALERYSDERWNRVIDINLNGIFATARAAARHMRPRRFGRIIVTTSLAATVVEPVDRLGLHGRQGRRQALHALASRSSWPPTGSPPTRSRRGSSSPTSAAATPTTPSVQAALAKDIPMHRVGSARRHQGARPVPRLAGLGVHHRAGDHHRRRHDTRHRRLKARDSGEPAGHLVRLTRHAPRADHRRLAATCPPQGAAPRRPR